MGGRGLAKGFGVIVDKTYKLKEIQNIGCKIVPSVTVAVNNVSKAQKVGKAVGVANTIANCIKKVIDLLKKYIVREKVINLLRRYLAIGLGKHQSENILYVIIN